MVTRKHGRQDVAEENPPKARQPSPAGRQEAGCRCQQAGGDEHGEETGLQELNRVHTPCFLCGRLPVEALGRTPSIQQHSLAMLASRFKSSRKTGWVCTQSWRQAKLQIEFLGRLARQRIDHPLLVPVRSHEFVLSQVGKMLGNGDLRHLEHRLKMADAERSFGEQMEDAQPGFVAETTINLNQMVNRPCVLTGICVITYMQGKDETLHVQGSLATVPQSPVTLRAAGRRPRGCARTHHGSRPHRQDVHRLRGHRAQSLDLFLAGMGGRRHRSSLGAGHARRRSWTKLPRSSRTKTWKWRSSTRIARFRSSRWRTSACRVTT